MLSHHITNRDKGKVRDLPLMASSKRLARVQLEHSHEDIRAGTGQAGNPLRLDGLSGTAVQQTSQRI